MASPSLLHSTASSFKGQCLVFPAKSTTLRFPASCVSASRPTGGPALLTVRAAGERVMVDKSEAETVHRLKTTYLNKIVPLLKEEFSYTNILQVGSSPGPNFTFFFATCSTHYWPCFYLLGIEFLVPKIEKVVINCGIGEATKSAKDMDVAINEMALIAGQRPVKTRAKKSIATFKLREGQPIGIAVTLRGKLMYAFLDRLINLALPRVRDFQGVNPDSFDGHGNFSLGFSEQSAFPDVPVEAIVKPRGFDVCIATTAKTDKEAFKMLALMGMPFREGDGPAEPVRKKKLTSRHFDSKRGGRKY